MAPAGSLKAVNWVIFISSEWLLTRQTQAETPEETTLLDRQQKRGLNPKLIEVVQSLYEW